MHVGVLAADAGADRHHVARRAIVGVHRSEDVIEQRALVELGVADVGLQREQLVASA